MDFAPTIPTDKFGRIYDELLIKAEEVCLVSSSIAGIYHSDVVDAIKGLLRNINSYYSNRIESEGTHPINIEKASKKIFSDDSLEKKMQQLSLAYIETQKNIEYEMLKNTYSPYSKEFISMLHRQFYNNDGMDLFLDIQYEDKVVRMTPGAFRQHWIKIGQHVGPSPENIDGMMNEFEHAYSTSLNKTLAEKLIYALASHHRLVWIHPFLDGNGRTSRLALDGALYAIKLPGYGLWNISRGLARDIKKYQSSLGSADMERQGDLDGRGPLSAKGLFVYVDFMLDCLFDQVAYMKQLLKLDKLSHNINQYVALTQAGLLEVEALPKHSEKIFQYLLVNGATARGVVFEYLGISPRSGSRIVSELLRREYIVSDVDRGPIRLNFPVHFSSYIFPELIPPLR